MGNIPLALSVFPDPAVLPLPLELPLPDGLPHMFDEEVGSKGTVIESTIVPT
jgi:hypothetical protein